MQDDQMFRDLERQLFDAHVRRDVLALEDMYAEDFFSTNADGHTVNKKEWLKIVRSGQFPVDAINTGDFQLRQYGNVAIITGWSDYIHAGAVVWSVRHTQVWVHDGQRWRFHLWHGTPRPQ